MDGENLTGSASEFLEIVGHTVGSEPTSDTPEPEDASLSAAADTDSADEEEIDLSPDERVAAVLGEDVDEDEDEPPEMAADEDEDEDADPNDLDSLTEEQKTELLEEALRARAEASQPDIVRIQAEAQDVSATAMHQMRQRIDTAFQQEVVQSVSEPHYGRLIVAAVENNDAVEVQRIVRAKTLWEAERRKEWEPEANGLIEGAGKQALKQHPGIRRLYAQTLAEQRNLPQKAIDTILEESDTDRMHTVADHLKELRDVKLDERRRGNQQVRENAAKNMSDGRITPPATGRPKPSNVVPLRGTADEWLAARKRGAV